MRQLANETGKAATVPITVRQLEAIVRLSEALAKMQLRHEATEKHVREAIRLFNAATMDATAIGLDTSEITKKILTETLSQTVDMLERKPVIENKT
ncbi:hypothetical protein ACFX10_028870 [Malus domestica]